MARSPSLTQSEIKLKGITKYAGSTEIFFKSTQPEIGLHVYCENAKIQIFE
jgi:hypothetical protein